MSKADQLIMERRLRPIYDAIDAGNAKKAVQEADKVLKKHPVTVCAKVLKALALIRSDKLAEGFEIINSLDVPGAQFDEGTLQAFVHCFKARENPEMGAKMLYPLAARMVENHVGKYGYKAGAEIELHTMVLEGMNRFIEAEELLGAEESRALLSTPPKFLMARRLALLLSAGKYQTVVERTVEGLNPDDWTLWKVLFDSSFELLRKNEEEEQREK
ncbi:hypothetical protein NECAME_10231 [Necator americanus]|uniref:Uncharacterized protein n=1 Tax=Necator americanus TaxID=51031 RepID=W2TC64_NECAM|nr:hypothetical protein NECAME_10231 [Necator americanus]ETN78602.1 hypothetical protein NECAME_10231 [Necator americanus]